jgi:hypothetical protein
MRLGCGNLPSRRNSQFYNGLIKPETWAFDYQTGTSACVHDWTHLNTSKYLATDIKVQLRPTHFNPHVYLCSLAPY